MSIAAVRLLARSTLADWRAIHMADLQFWHRGEARLALLGLVAVTGLLLGARSALSRQPGRHRLVVPAVLSSLQPSYLSFVRHVPLVLFLAGMPFFSLALADPYTSLVTSDVTYPGRRIAIMIDASSSMHTPFRAPHVNQRGETEAAFFTTVAAAERFVNMRRTGRYKDPLIPTRPVGPSRTLA